MKTQAEIEVEIKRLQEVRESYGKPIGERTARISRDLVDFITTRIEALTWTLTGDYKEPK